MIDTYLKGFKKEDSNQMLTLSKYKKDEKYYLKLVVESNYSNRSIEINNICENEGEYTDIDVNVKLKDIGNVASLIQTLEDKQNKVSLVIFEELVMFKIENGMIVNFLFC